MLFFFSNLTSVERYWSFPLEFTFIGSCSNLGWGGRASGGLYHYWEKVRLQLRVSFKWTLLCALIKTLQIKVSICAIPHVLRELHLFLLCMSLPKRKRKRKSVADWQFGLILHDFNSTTLSQAHPSLSLSFLHRGFPPTIAVQPVLCSLSPGHQPPVKGVQSRGPQTSGGRKR